MLETVPSPATAPTGDAAVRLRALRKSYPGSPPVHAVAGIDLDVARGEMFGLLGPNGAGKSTTVGICTTRIRPTSGTVELLGLDVVEDPSRVKRRIGVVTQTNTLDRSLTLSENLYYHCRYFGVPARQARARTQELLDRFRLADRHAAFPDQISGGMAQRLQVARAIAHHPEVLFLDEPTAGLDPQSRIALWELVEGLRHDGMTVVLTTHYMEEAEALCDRVAIVDHGQVLVCDTPVRLKDEHGQGAVIDVTLRDQPDDPIDTARLRERITALPVVRDVELEGNTMRVFASALDGVIGALAETLGGGLKDLAVQDANLESVFINLTGRDLRE